MGKKYDSSITHYTYPKVRNVYWRDMEGTKKVIQGQYENDTFKYLADLEWEATLKLDGTNVALVWDGHKIGWQGRTEKTQLSMPQLEYLASLATEELEELLEQNFGEELTVIYGELVGKGIQRCGASYKDDGYRWIVFDVYRPEADQWWSRDAVNAVATSLALEYAPIMARGKLPYLVNLVRQRQKDPMASGDLEWEGLVARPLIEMKDNNGRIITKIKVKDVCE